jgi:UDP:flavonoid glycosyltransferase YjiC (YdhE family)
VRGDVQPYLALAVRLRRAGHHVTLATSHTFTQWIESYGVRTHPTAFSLADLSLAAGRLASPRILDSPAPVSTMCLQS